MGQEPTTIAVSEPALSFEFDSSQSLFEQLTKAQQANTSSFSAHAGTPFSQSTSPVMRAVDSMPPPQMMPPPSLPTVAEEEAVGVGGVAMGSQVGHHPHHPHHHPHASQQHHHHHAQQQHHHQYAGAMPAYTTHPHHHHAHHVSMSASLPPAVAHGAVKGEPDYGQHLYDRSSMVPVGAPGRPQPRHASMPTYLEYSPAPSFVSSGYDDYTNRAISYEPLTPPQPAIPFGAEPAYIANEDTGLYSALPDVTSAHAMGSLSQLPPPHVGGSLYPSSATSAAAMPPSAGRPYGGPNHVYHVIEGSPTYKQRRRRSSISSISAGVAAAAAAAATTSTSTSAGGNHPSHRPSELRRSVSDSVPPVPEDDEGAVVHETSPPPAGATSGQALSNAYGLNGPTHAELLDLSRHGTPLPTLEGSPSLGPHASAPSASALMPPPDEFGALPASAERVHESPTPGQVGMDKRAPPPGVLRRARSATVMELGPYPQKSHSCPIPTCGRLFKRLEHLKR